MITADEARKISLKSLHTVEYMLYAIECMAKDGKRFAAHDARDYTNPEEVKKQLEDLGYTVTLEPDFLKAEW